MVDPERDPDRRPPAILWLMLGLVVAVAFAAAVMVVGGRISHRAVGPPAGAPADAR
jgi:hypothetical protein